MEDQDTMLGLGALLMAAAEAMDPVRVRTMFKHFPPPQAENLYDMFLGMEFAGVFMQHGPFSAAGKAFLDQHPEPGLHRMANQLSGITVYNHILDSWQVGEFADTERFEAMKPTIEQAVTDYLTPYAAFLLHLKETYGS